MTCVVTTFGNVHTYAGCRQPSWIYQHTPTVPPDYYAEDNLGGMIIGIHFMQGTLAYPCLYAEETLTSINIVKNPHL